MGKLSFNQRVWMGFLFILALLTLSSIATLVVLNNISGANEQITDEAVPVVRSANQVQIQLLKLVNLGALGKNALAAEEIKQYIDIFETSATEYLRLFDQLASLAAQVPEMPDKVAKVKTNYEQYLASIHAMFDAKLAALEANASVVDEHTRVVDSLGVISDALMEISFYELPEEHMDLADMLVGTANDIESRFYGASLLADELIKATDETPLDDAEYGFMNVLKEAMLVVVMLERSFKEADPGGLLDAVNESIKGYETTVTDPKGLVHYKRIELQQARLAIEKFDEAKRTVAISVASLDEILSVTDNALNVSQESLLNTIDLGIKTSVGLLVLLLLLATQNFNSMRAAIRKKVRDLAQLNQIGANLAAARSQTGALDEVLQAMESKININKGSVYLLNENEEYETKAFLPALEGEEAGHKPKSFAAGEGILGRVAEDRKTEFVADTSKDNRYVDQQSGDAKSLLCVPLMDQDDIIGVMNFSGDVDQVSFADSDYEFVSTVAQSLVTTLKNISMVEVIEEHNRNLEEKVAQRTAALKQKNDDIANMLSNMHQGLFTIEEGGRIHPEYSAYLENIFKTDQIANRDFAELLFEHAVMSADDIDGCTAAVSTIIGEDDMMYDFNSHLLSSEIKIQLSDGEERYLDVDWDPILDEEDTVSRLMVTVRDVTELRALQAAAEEQKQELNIIGEILSISPAKFSEFINTSGEFIDKCREQIKTTKEKDAEVLAALFRNIHTVKGNARTYGFKRITDVVHLVENTYDELRKTEELEWKPDELLEELETAENAVGMYAEIADIKLHRSNSEAEAANQIETAVADELVQQITALDGQSVSENVVSIVKNTYKALARLDAKPIDVVINDVIESVKSLAGELGKLEPTIEVDAADVLLKENTHSMLNNIFMHVMRNAIDHGIEKPEDRVAERKPAHGTIQLNTVVDGDMVRFSVSDDGRGIALSKIYEKAVENGLYGENDPRPPASEIANLIFASGFSTAEAVTEVSGRGVGMDAVKQFLKSEGGGIEVVLGAGEQTADFRPFSTVISLPLSNCRLMPSLAVAN